MREKRSREEPAVAESEFIRSPPEKIFTRARFGGWARGGNGVELPRH